jgi:hypothetical protein
VIGTVISIHFFDWSDFNDIGSPDGFHIRKNVSAKVVCFEFAKHTSILICSHLIIELDFSHYGLS